MPEMVRARIARNGAMAAFGLAIVIMLVVPALRPWAVVEAGFRGVVVQFGAVKAAVLEPGFHLKAPTFDVISYDVRVQKIEVQVDAASRDLQSVMAIIAVNYHPKPETVNELHKEVGKAYQAQVIDPRLQEAVKAVTARFTAEELITRRQDMREEVRRMLSERLADYGIVVDDFSVVNFAFSEEFNRAIEAKQTAEQLALKAQRDLERVKIEAEQKVAQAQAEAESLRIQRENVSPELLQLRAIEKWDGKLPQVTGGAVPFIGGLNLNAGGR